MELHLAVRKVRVQEFKIRCLMQRSYFTQSYSTSQLCFASCYSIACGKPPSHREVAPRECAVHPRWKPQRSRREEKQKRRRRRRRRQSRKTEAACVGSACHNNLLTVYPVEQRQVLCMSLRLDGRPLNGRRQGGSGERLPQARLLCTLGGSRREKEKEKRRRRQGCRAEATCVNNLLAKQQMSTGRSGQYYVPPVRSTAIDSRRLQCCVDRFSNYLHCRFSLVLGEEGRSGSRSRVVVVRSRSRSRRSTVVVVVVTAKKREEQRHKHKPRTETGTTPSNRTRWQAGEFRSFLTRNAKNNSLQYNQTIMGRKPDINTLPPSSTWVSLLASLLIPLGFRLPRIDSSPL